MPGKDRRVAARQAKLRQRRKKQSRGPSGIPSAGPPLADVGSRTRRGVATEIPEPPAPSPNTPSSSRPRPEGAWRSPARVRGEQPITHLYVGPELRRILILTSVILAILIIVTILLR